MRRKLIEELRRKGIRDEAVLQVMEQLPRHYFLDKAFEERAYEDKPFPKRHKVLEIGTGSGYQAAILAMLGARVYTVERYEALYRQAKALLESLGLKNVRCFFRDGSKGLPEHAPFDRIIATAGAPEVPEALKQQLAIGGILVIPVGIEVQGMMRIVRTSETEYLEEDTGDFRFVPFLGGTEPER